MHLDMFNVNTPLYRTTKTDSLLLKNSELLIRRLDDLVLETAERLLTRMAFPFVESIFTFSSCASKPLSTNTAFLLCKNVVLYILKVPLVKMLPLDRNDNAKPLFS